MDGIHDMGGMHGFGKVAPEKNEPVFHAAWEGRCLALNRAMSAIGAWTIDEGRAGIEALPPDVYLASSYYGKWALHIHPTWTRDGKELIFISNRDNKHGSGGFYRMKAEPGAQMHRFYYEETTWKARPTLSPDGAK